MTVPLRAGGYVLGVRISSVAAARAIETLFGARVSAGAQPPANLSVWLAPSVDRGPQELHRLYETYRHSLRTRSLSRMLLAIWHELDARDVRVAGGGPLVDATVLVRDGRAHLLPPAMRRPVVTEQRRWQAAGFALVDRRWLVLDLGEGTIKVPSPGEEFARDALPALRLAGLHDRRDGDIPFGEFPVVSWTVPGFDQSAARRGMVSVGQVLDRPGRLSGRDAARLVALVHGLPQTLLVPGGLHELRAQLQGM